MDPRPASPDAQVALYWLPLGAGAHVVRRCGRAYERCLALREHRPALDLVHAALEVRSDAGRFVVEVAPVWDHPASDRGVVAEGPVGHPWLGRSRWFRYEVRRWRDGVIPDVAFALGGRRVVSTDHEHAEAVLDLLPAVPTPTWGRDELATGDMWNSNAVVAWVLARSGHDLGRLALPAGTRAPGWLAGAIVAGRPHPPTSPVQASARLA